MGGGVGGDETLAITGDSRALALAGARGHEIVNGGSGGAGLPGGGDRQFPNNHPFFQNLICCLNPVTGLK